MNTYFIVAIFLVGGGGRLDHLMLNVFLSKLHIVNPFWPHLNERCIPTMFRYCLQVSDSIKNIV